MNDIIIENNPPTKVESSPSQQITGSTNLTPSPLDALLARLREKLKHKTKGAFGRPSLQQQLESKKRLKRAAKRKAKAAPVAKPNDGTS